MRCIPPVHSSLAYCEMHPSNTLLICIVVIGPKPKPLTLAQKLGLIDHPAAPLTDSQWQSAKAKSNARNDSSLPCVICKEPFAYQQQVLLSCSHVFHHACLSAFERFTGKKTCPLCRQKDYETRVIHEASKLHRVQCATTIQSAWRGHRVRTWYNEMRRTVVPRDPKLRRKFYEEKFVEANNRFVREVEETETAARNLIRDIDENLAYSRRISQLLNRRLIETTVDWKAVRATAAARNVTECPICIVPLDISLTNETTKEYPHGHMSIQTTTSERLRGAVDGERCHRKTVLLSCCHAFHEACFDTFEQLCSGSFDLVCPVCRSLYSKLTIEQ